MSSHRAEKSQIPNDVFDSLIRWAVHDSVAGAEPSPRVWERIQQRVEDDREAAAARPRYRHRRWSRRMWLGWLVGAGAGYPVPGDPRFAWQRRLHPFDVRAPQSIVRIVEGKMPALRLVS